MCFYILFKLLFLNVYFYSLKLYSSIIKAINSFINWFYSIWTDIFFRIICYFFYCRKIFFRCVKMINCNLIHCNIHYRTVSSLCIMSLLYWIILRWSNLRGASSTLSYAQYHSINSTTLLFLYFFAWLKNRWK